MLAEAPTVPSQAASAAPRRRWRKSREFLLISIGLHLLFGVGAGYLVVSKYTAARKLTFNAGPKSPNRAERAIQHRVQLHEKMKTAPAVIPKRVLSTGRARIELPAIPQVPRQPDPVAAPQLMAAAGKNATFDTRPSLIGSLAGTGTGAAINFFGIRDRSSRVVIMIDVSDSMFTHTGDAEGVKLIR